MRLRVVIALAVLFAGIPAAPSLLAQQGHPLTGSWYGEWGKDAENITIVVTWDNRERDLSGEVVMLDKEKKLEKVVVDKSGKPVFTVAGMFNPGPNSRKVTMTLDSVKWTVRIETEFKDDAGKVSKVVADGRLENVGSDNRTITGTWTQGTVKGDFKLRRD
jgi:hypothetical protein